MHHQFSLIHVIVSSPFCERLFSVSANMTSKDRKPNSRGMGTTGGSGTRMVDIGEHQSFQSGVVGKNELWHLQHTLTDPTAQFTSKLFSDLANNLYEHFARTIFPEACLEFEQYKLDANIAGDDVVCCFIPLLSLAVSL